MGSDDNNGKKQEHGTTDQYDTDRIPRSYVTNEDVVGTDVENQRNVPWEVFKAPTIVDRTTEVEKKVEEGTADDLDDPEEIAKETVEDVEDAGEIEELTPAEKQIVVSYLTTVFTAILTGDPISALTVGGTALAVYATILKARDERRRAESTPS